MKTITSALLGLAFLMTLSGTASAAASCCGHDCCKIKVCCNRAHQK